jgi:peptide/nickel transport system permease protein
MMFGYIGRRAYHSIISVIGLLTLVFFLTRMTGDPSALYLPLDSSLEARQDFARLNGLDQPIYVQFVQYLKSLLSLDFGQSLRQNRSAIEVALEAFPATLKLALVAMALAITLAIIPAACLIGLQASSRSRVRARRIFGSRLSASWSLLSAWVCCPPRERGQRCTGLCRSQC